MRNLSWLSGFFTGLASTTVLFTLIGDNHNDWGWGGVVVGLFLGLIFFIASKK